MTNDHSPASIEILLAEDSPTQAEHIASALRSHGFRVRVVRNGREALEAARERKPTLIVSDINMPEMDGYELCRHVRHDPALADLPLILLTSLSDPEDVFRGLECGADNFISKPCEDDYLFARIQHLLSNRHLRRRESSPVELEVIFANRRHHITADRIQILNLLLSTYEAAVQKNRALTAMRDELRLLNEALEERVGERTAELRAEVVERKRAEEEVRRLNEELEQRVRSRTAQLEAANHELDAFAQSISHDLRTPLRAISGFSDILLTRHTAELSDTPRRLLNIVNANVQRMGRMIDSLLLFARTSRQRLNRRRVSMTQLVEEAVTTLAQTLQERHIEFVTPPLPDCSGDSALLAQVWMNLLGNAVKFTRDRPVARVETGSLLRDGSVVYFVRDNGAGFDPRYADRLFGVFQRLHADAEFEGTGIGLSIVQRIVARHGGRIWPESQPDHGATFYFTLPEQPS